MSDQHDYDVVVIGSGFGGSVAALRLTEKGYRVGVLEAGRRFADDELPRTSWDVRNFLWAPALGLLGVQRIHVLQDVIVLAGAGVGGGSLVYANTLYRPSADAFYDDPQWSGITDWRTELAPYYDQATRMLGVVQNPTVTPADEAMRRVADSLGVGGTFTLTPVGVFFGRDGRKEPDVEVDDPYFGGAGPRRTGCRECGECMTGCRHGAKNTLVKNYLHLAERGGAVIHPETTVERLRPLGDGWLVHTVRTGRRGREREPRTYTAGQVVVAAGAWGTQQLLHRMRATGDLPALSGRLGTLSRTNSESLGGAMAGRRRGGPDYSQGVAITSSIHVDDHTHLEPVRYGHGSNVMGLLGTVLVPEGPGPAWLRWLKEVARHPVRMAGYFGGLRHWSERTVIGLVMQSRDNSLTVRARRTFTGRLKLASRPGEGEPNPVRIPQAHTAFTALADAVDGYPMGNVGEVADLAMTAHFIGGCVLGADAEHGVVDPYHRAFGHPGLHVLDGSTIPANLGVNPSLTITALAERAVALWPNNGEPDPRPAVGEPYRTVSPVAPTHPVVPAGAPGELRWSGAPDLTPS